MKDDCGLCQRYGHGCQYHPDDPPSESVTGVNLSARQLVAVEILLTRAPDETLAEVAERIGVTPRTLYRYLNEPEFVGEFRKRVEDDLGGARGRVASALIRGACRPGHGQAGMQKIYWQRLGELTDRHELTGADGGPIITKIVREIVDPAEEPDAE